MNDGINWRAVLDEALRRDFATFVAKVFDTISPGDRFSANWHHEAIGWRLDQLAAGSTSRLIITMPPRSLKSIIVSVAWVAWRLGHNPALRFVCVSYSAELSTKHARDCRAVMMADWYRRIFPRTCLSPTRSAEHDFETTRRGGRFSTSVGGTITGRGGDIIIIDDPMKPEDAMSEAARASVIGWYANTLSSRLNDKTKGAIVLVMQRLHEDDLAGHLLDGGGWDHLSLPAISEEDEAIPIGPDAFHPRCAGEALHTSREPVALLEQMKAQMGAAIFSAQYQQAPVPAGGNIIQRAWFRRYVQLPDGTSGGQIVQSWDTATKDGVTNDWSVCITAWVDRHRIYICDVFRQRLQFPELRKAAIGLARNHGARVLLIEDAASGQQLIQQLRYDQPAGVPSPIARRPVGDKITRMSGQSSRIEAGDLFLPYDAPWLALFERELLACPNGRTNDQVDALSQLLAWCTTAHHHAISFAAPIILE